MPVIPKSFTIQAFIALTILASTLTSSVNADIALPRQFHFLSLVVTYESLTSDLGFAREGYERDTVPTATVTDEKRFRRLLFLGLVLREGRC